MHLQIPPPCFQLITQALPMPASMGTTSCLMPQLPSTAPRLQPVRMANGHLKRLVASATLASATALPPAALLGHVMPNFPHTLIGLGPFANQDCTIVFTKTAVTVYHLDAHPILTGWQDETDLWLWHFPLNAKAAIPQDATGATALRPSIPPPSPLLVPSPSVTLLPTSSPMAIPPAVLAAFPPHPSQGIMVTDMSRIACLVYYL